MRVLCECCCEETQTKRTFTQRMKGRKVCVCVVWLLFGLVSAALVWF